MQHLNSVKLCAYRGDVKIDWILVMAYSCANCIYCSSMRSQLLPENHFSLKIVEEVNQLCYPLFNTSVFKKYGIDYFIYSRYYADGSIYVLSTNDQVYTHFFNNNYSLIPFIQSELISNKFSYYPTLNNKYELFIQEMYDMQNLFNVYHSLFLFELQNDYLDMFIYSSRLNSYGVINFYNNYFDILEKFSSYFRSQASKLIKKSNQHKIILPEKMRPDYIFSNDNNKMLVKKQEIEKNLAVKRYVLSSPKYENVHITRREGEILTYLTKGYTAKELAKLINISEKTIDAHLSNIKNRLGLTRKRELFEVALEINAFDPKA